MLVLKHRMGERTQLLLPDGSLIWVAVVQVCNGFVRLGFDAPTEVKIMREKLLTSQERRRR